MSSVFCCSFLFNRYRIITASAGFFVILGLINVMNMITNQRYLFSLSLPETIKNQAPNSFDRATPSDVYHTGLNLLEDTGQISSTISVDSCTQESMNLNRLQQDHPCVIEIIKRSFLHPPAAPNVPYALTQANIMDPSAGQATGILNYLENQKEGFFIECGAVDGERLSNTLYMERYLNWKGILIEADQTSFGRLLSRRRKSYALPVCLSLEPYPTQVTFKVVYLLGSIQENTKPNENGKKSKKREDGDMITVQCFPIYSILLAVGRTQVDFFSLDVEGHELRILNTIPWHKVDIKTLTVEWDHVGQKPLIDLLGSKGYYVFGRNEVNVGRDLFFARNYSLNVK